MWETQRIILYNSSVVLRVEAAHNLAILEWWNANQLSHPCKKKINTFGTALHIKFSFLDSCFEKYILSWKPAWSGNALKFTAVLSLGGTHVRVSELAAVFSFLFYLFPVIQQGVVWIMSAAPKSMSRNSSSSKFIEETYKKAFSGAVKLSSATI